MEVIIMKVAKFGGTSLASAQQIKKVCSIILSDPERQLIVVSAPGKRNKHDIKVTDLLIACAESFLKTGCAESELEAIVSRYREIAENLGLSEDITNTIHTDIRNRLDTNTSDKEKFMDSVKASGEDNCAKLVAAYLKSLGHEAKYINPRDAGLILSGEYGNARVLPESYENLKSLREVPGIKIFPGFFGYSKTGDVITFSRGGSDVTGSILTAATDAKLYENYTDVDCVYSVNPNIVQNPKPINKMTYREMRELSYAGFSVFHEEALVPVYKKGIPVCIKNTNNPDSPGTTIVPSLDSIDRTVVGIAGGGGFCSIYIRKYLMNREVGFGRKMLGILEDEGLSYEHMPSGIDDISIILEQKQLDNIKQERVISRIKKELDIEYIDIDHDLALIMLVGEGLRNTIGLAERATEAISRANINIEMINQGSSEVSIMFGVKEQDCDTAIKYLYDEFFKN
jgi:aspartate kinase